MEKENKPLGTERCENTDTPYKNIIIIINITIIIIIIIIIVIVLGYVFL